MIAGAEGALQAVEERCHHRCEERAPLTSLPRCWVAIVMITTWPSTMACHCSLSRDRRRLGCYVCTARRARLTWSILECSHSAYLSGALNMPLHSLACAHSLRATVSPQLAFANGARSHALAVNSIDVVACSHIASRLSESMLLHVHAHHCSCGHLYWCCD
jgi:hypothetical protein